MNNIVTGLIGTMLWKQNVVQDSVISCGSSCVEIISLIISAINVLCSIAMIIIMIYQITPAIKELQKRHDNNLERTKIELIYKRYFGSEVNLEPKDEKFKEGIQNVYKDIRKIMPDLTLKGYKQEDWLLAEWLLREKKYAGLGAPTESEIRDLADKIPTVRTNGVR